MLCARLCQAAWPNPYGQSLKSALTLRINATRTSHLVRSSDVRHFVDNSRGRISHVLRRKTLADRTLAPAGEAAHSIGKGALAGGAIVGLGALCYYGLGMSSEIGTVEKSILWPQYVKDRIMSTYMYLGGSIAVSVASAAAVFQNPRLVELLSRGGFVPLFVTLGALIGSGILAQSIPYSPGLGLKQLAWMGHSAIIGAVLVPMAFLGGPILLRAGLYTAGIVGGLSAVAVCAPSERFLMMGGPLAIGLGVVFAASVGSMFASPATALGSSLYAISLYGGLLLFSAFLLYDTQRIIKRAEEYPPDRLTNHPFDPINASLSIYMNAVNIFTRMVILLSGGGNRKR